MAYNDQLAAVDSSDPYNDALLAQGLADADNNFVSNDTAAGNSFLDKILGVGLNVGAQYLTAPLQKAQQDALLNQRLAAAQIANSQTQVKASTLFMYAGIALAVALALIFGIRMLTRNR